MNVSPEMEAKIKSLASNIRSLGNLDGGLATAPSAQTPLRSGSKYRNRRVRFWDPMTAGEVVFDSLKERDRYILLLAAWTAGAIWGLARQVPYECRVDGVLVCRYVADFTYFDGPAGSAAPQRIEDAKGYRNATYKLKKKLFEACYAPLKITEV